MDSKKDLQNFQITDIIFKPKNKEEIKGLMASQIKIQNDYFLKSQHIDNLTKSVIKLDEDSFSENSLLEEESNKSSFLEDEKKIINSLLLNKDIKIQELEKEKEELKKENEELNEKITQLFKMMNEILKIHPTNINFDSNYDEIKNKITAMYYREIRLKNVLPFSRLVSTYGLTMLNNSKKDKIIKKSVSVNTLIDNEFN